MANLEENNNAQQATSNIETADEVEQQQTTQQLPDISSGIVITSGKSKKAAKRKTSENIKNENSDDGPLADYFGRFDGKYTYYQQLIYNRGGSYVGVCTCILLPYT